VEPDALDPADAEHRQRVVVLQPPELSLDGGAATVEALPFVALARQAALTEAAVAAERDDCGYVAVGALGVDAPIGAAISIWRRIAEEPPADHPELTALIDTDYAKLQREGKVRGPRLGLGIWQEALTSRARHDGLPLYCDRHTRRAHVLDPEVRMPLRWLRELRAEVGDDRPRPSRPPSLG
jgi:hypothetical protein